MKNEWSDKRAARLSNRLPSLRAQGGPARIRLFSRGRRIDPFTRWPAFSGLIEAFADALLERPAAAPSDDAVASMVSGLLEGTGCAIVTRTAAGDRTSIVTATGTWEKESLSESLSALGCPWILALKDEPMLVVRGRRGVSLRVPRMVGRPSSSAVAFPMTLDAERVGGLVVTYDSSRSYGSSFFAAGKLLVTAVGLQLLNGRLADDVRRHSERISRLRSDVERMGVLLRRLPGTEPPA